MRYGGLLLVLFLIGCGAERQNFLARNYHTFVSYFNGYYHADKRFRTAQAEIELKTPDPSEGYVRVFPLIDPAIAREHYTRLEEATKKCEVIIFRHKNGRYVDDCRTLIGQCWVLRSNLPNAEQNFSYVLSAFPGTPLRPKVYWWEAYTALQDHNPYRAETRLTEILGMSSREVPRRLRAEAEALLAQALIEKGEPALAVKFLERSAPKLGTRLRRARAYYLLGQLYLEQKKPEAAFQAFQKVVRLNPTNQLTFQAQLQKSLLAGARDPRLLRRLERMAQQTRYEDYRDQIYYRLGHIALESQNYEAALAYFKKAGGGGSSPARALAHYEAGNIYFMHYQDLASAQKHYDSAASLIPENHPRAAELKALQSRFQEYGRLRHEVKLYDSLLTLSSLSPEELDRSLEAYIQSEVSRRAAEKARQQAQAQGSSAMPPNPFLQQTLGSSGGGGFYFDNPMLVSQGKQEFKRLWGDRPDEDHWRRRQKSPLATSSAAAGESHKKGAEADTTKVIWPDDPAALTPQKVAELKRRLRSQIPQTPAQKRAIEDSLIVAALLLAQLYQEAFQRPDSAKKIYVWLYQRLPHRSEARAPALYGLYVLSYNTPESEKYKQELLSRYPDSEYAQRLKGGHRFDEKSTVEDIHAALLEAYQRQEYESVVGFAKATESRWQKTPSEPAIRYLWAAALLHLQNYEEAKLHLRQLIQNFPQAPCTPIAQKLLSRLEKGQTQLIAESAPAPNTPTPSPSTPSSSSPGGTPFSLEHRANEPILVLILVPKDRISNEDLKQHIARTNQNAFADNRLSVVVFLYEQAYYLAYIAQFGDYRAADAYISTLAAQPWFQNLQLKPYQDIFPITQSNFRIAYTQKRLHEYAAFLAQNRAQLR
jgi:tetratricopeptide (TPR) repeat protein